MILRNKKGQFLKGSKHPFEYLEKAQQSHTGIPRTEETKAKIKRNNAKYWLVRAR